MFHRRIAIMKKLLSLLLTLTLLPATLWGQAQIDESTIKRSIVVDPSGGGDCKTLGEAFSFLNKNPDLPIKVLIKPGIYREPVTKVDPRKAAATVIEGTDPEKVIITGADIWKDWKDEGKGRYSAPWPHDWGITDKKVAHSKDFYDKHVTDEVAKRTEIVWWGDDRMWQVNSLEELKAGSFFADEAGDKLWLMPPAGQSMGKVQVEVSIRHQLVWFRQVNNLVLRNITFQRAANGSQHGDGRFGVAVFGNTAEGDFRVPSNVSFHLKIENCRFIENNSSGLTAANYENVSIINSDFSDNGISGAGISRLRYVELTGSRFKRNNWRIGGYGKFYDWVPSGVKFLQCADMLIEDSVFEDNLSSGLWFDWQLERINVRNIKSNNNAGAGVYMEASIGPFVITDSEFIGNGKLQNNGVNHGGVLIAETRNVTVNNCLIAENSHGQVVIRSMDRPGVGGYFSGERFDGSVKYVALLNNRMIGKTIVPVDEVRASWHTSELHSGGLIMCSTHTQSPLYEEHFLTTLWASGNTYYHPDVEAVFSTGLNHGWKRVSLNEWQKKYGLDQSSSWDNSLKSKGENAK